MTSQLKQAIRVLLDCAKKQGTDTMGYVHYVDRVYFDDLEFEFIKECRKEGQLQYIGKQYVAKKGNENDPL